MGAGQYDDPDCPEARAGLDEADPQEEAGVERCDAEVARCEFRLGDLEGKADESEFTIMDEIHEQMRVESIQVIADPEDGLPHPVTGPTQFAPPFTYDTMVCIEDERRYVEVFADEMVELGWVFADGERGVHQLDDLYSLEHDDRPHVEVDGMSWEGDARPVLFFKSGTGKTVAFRVRCMFDHRGIVRSRETVLSPVVTSHFGLDVCFAPDEPASFPPMVVRPIRERCKHYKRMCVANDDQPDPDEFMHYIRFRNCSMRRSVGGAFLSLRDEAVYACDYRDPPDPATEQLHLDGPDQKKLSDKPHLVKLPLFGLEGDVLNEKEKGST